MSPDKIEVRKPHIGVDVDFIDSGSTFHLKLTECESRDLHAQLGEVLGIPAQSDGVNQLSTVLSRTQAIAASRGREADRLCEVVEVRDAEIAGYKGTIADLQAAAERLKGQLSQRDKAVLELKGQLMRLKRELADARSFPRAEIIERAKSIQVLAARLGEDVRRHIKREAGEILAALDDGETPEEPPVEHAEETAREVDGMPSRTERITQQALLLGQIVCRTGITGAEEFAEGILMLLESFMEEPPVEHAEETAREVDGQGREPAGSMARLCCEVAEYVHYDDRERAEELSHKIINMLEGFDRGIKRD
jgi:hypothetical protein